jgi:hypothetical protein
MIPRPKPPGEPWRLRSRADMLLGLTTEVPSFLGASCFIDPAHGVCCPVAFAMGLLPRLNTSNGQTPQVSHDLDRLLLRARPALDRSLDLQYVAFFFTDGQCVASPVPLTFAGCL